MFTKQYSLQILRKFLILMNNYLLSSEKKIFISVFYKIHSVWNFYF